MLLYSSTKRVLHHLGRHAGAGGVAEGGQARTGLDQQRVGMAVVAAFKLDESCCVRWRRAPGGWRSWRLRCRS